MSSRKKYSSPAPTTADLLTLADAIEKQFGLAAGWCLVPTRKGLVYVHAEVSKPEGAEMITVVSVVEIATAADENLTGTIYRAMLRAYWASEDYKTRDLGDRPEDTPF